MLRRVRSAIVLPTMPAGANPEGIAAAAETAERLGWSTAWTSDEVLVRPSAAEAWGTTYELIVTLAWVGARFTRLRLGTSVIVVPKRNAVVLAKELASLDSLVGGRLVVGVGVGSYEVEFAHVGAQERFHTRGAYLDETIALWRHLWSGQTASFEGQFHQFSDFVFGPLPAQGGHLPIVIGGHSEAAFRRAGRLGDGLHVDLSGPPLLVEQLAMLRAALEAAGRPAIEISGRVNVRFVERPAPRNVLAGSPAEMLVDLRAYQDLGVDEIAFSFGETDAERARNAIERFDREVLSALR